MEHHRSAEGDGGNRKLKYKRPDPRTWAVGEHGGQHYEIVSSRCRCRPNSEEEGR